MKHQPPRLGRNVLRWVVNAEFVEEVEGDLEELFLDRVSRLGPFRANLFYYLDVLRAIRPYHVKRKRTSLGHEILNWIFFRLALRNLSKRKFYTLLNILGLSVGLVSFLLILEYVAFERSYDSFHTNADKIYRVAFDWGETDYNGVNSSVYASSVPAMGPALANEISGIKGYTRFVPVLTVKSYCIFSYHQNGKLKFSANADRGFYADSSFLKIFSFPVLTGSKDPLAKPQSIILTKSYAQAIFGNMPDDQIIGSLIEVDAQSKEQHIVTAILHDVPANSHIQFDYLISYATINSGRLEGNLGWSQFYTYILSDQILSSSTIEPELKKLTSRLYGKESRISIFLQPLKEIYLTSDLREEVGETGSQQQLTFLTIIGYAILLMAWINYINMFLAKSMERVNEIGVKKVLGSTRFHLIVQFFTESLVINCVSVTLSILAFALVQPVFESWLGKNVSLILTDGILFIIIFLAGVVINSIATGLYPAVVLSSYKPTQALGQKINRSTQGFFFKKGLVYFQFIISFIIVSSTLIINRQISFMKKADLGMELNGRVAVRSPGATDPDYRQKIQLYKDRLLRYSFIKNASSSSTVPGKAISTSGGVQRVIGPELEGNNVFYMLVDDAFLDTYGIRLIAGSNFSKRMPGVPTVIINEAAVKTLMFESPQEALNHRIHWQRKEYFVIGVFANYNHLFLKQAFEPTMLSFNESPPGFVTLRIDDGNYRQALDAAKREMDALFPGTPFEFDFLESTYNRQYHSVQQFELLAGYFALVAIVIASLGLFSLSYYTVHRRIREVAVRKVFGARVFDVLVLLSRQYIVIAVISSLLGTVISFYVMNVWLQNFAFAITLSAFDFFIPAVGITTLVLFTVIYNCLRTALANPSYSLKQN
jgi:putative ABC transport system permease protein